ncbi:MAG TPA: hypothetical protein VMD09_11245 [Solirubrobacteraceae bacterium]|nr:hypothetical protein [Solirubrobacteraceae bacterium]
MALGPDRREASPPSFRIRERQDPAYDWEAFLRDLERVAGRDDDLDRPERVRPASRRRTEAG